METIDDTQQSTGELSILSAGYGDIKIKFNQYDSAERQKAIAMIQDMKLRGYAILIQLEDGTYTRALDFDAERGEYIIVAPEPRTAISSVPALVDDVTPEPTAIADEVTAAPRKRGRARTALPMESVKAVSVGRSAGG